MYIDCYDISSPEMLANILQGYSEKVRLKFMVMAQQLRKTYQDHKHTVKVGETGNSVDTVERGKQVLVARGYSLEDLKMTFARVSAKSLRWNSLTFPRLSPEFSPVFPDSTSIFFLIYALLNLTFIVPKYHRRYKDECLPYLSSYIQVHLSITMSTLTYK